VSSAEDNGEVVDKGDAERHDTNEEMIIQTRSEGKDRPTLLRTGKAGGPRKIYHQVRLHVTTRRLCMRS